MEEFYRFLELDQEGVPYEFFRDVIRDVYDSLFRENNIFVQPKYYWSSEYDRLWNICLYFSDPKRRQLIIDLYHKPTEVLKLTGPYHPLWYMSVRIGRRQPILKFVLQNEVNEGYFVSLSELREFLSNVYQHITQIRQQLSIDDLDEPKEFRLVCEYSPEYNICYWKLDLPVLPELSYFLIESNHYKYDFAMVYPRIFHVARYSMETYYILNDMLVYLTNQKAVFDFKHLRYELENIEKLINFVNNLDKIADTTSSIPYILREIFYNSKLYIYDDDSKKVYQLYLHARKRYVQRISYNRFTEMIIERTL